MNDIKFEAKNDHTVEQHDSLGLQGTNRLAVAKFSDLDRLLTATT